MSLITESWCLSRGHFLRFVKFERLMCDLNRLLKCRCSACIYINLFFVNRCHQQKPAMIKNDKTVQKINKPLRRESTYATERLNAIHNYSKSMRCAEFHGQNFGGGSDWWAHLIDIFYHHREEHIAAAAENYSPNGPRYGGRNERY